MSTVLTKTLINTYPDLGDLSLTDIDIIDNGEILSTIPDNSLDFIICNHMLAHCQNPIDTIRNHLNKIKKGGILYYTIPNKNYTFDAPRKLTSLKHLSNDDICSPNKSKRVHLTEWAIYIDKITDRKKLKERLKFLDKIDYSIHYHVWDENTFNKFIKYTQYYLKNIFKIKELVPNYSEIIAILVKTN